MPDMLVKLYELDDDWHFLAAQKKQGIVIRKPIGPEKHPVVQWVADNFGTAWAAEARGWQPKGATGVGVRLVHEWLRQRV